MTKENITLEQSLQAYRIMHQPGKLSWKQHWANETFSNDDMLSCNEWEQKQYKKRLKECSCTICSNIKQTQGTACTLVDLIDVLMSDSNANLYKQNRKVVYSTGNGERPVGKKAFELWNGFQVIDLDIKNEDMAIQLKTHIFKHLYKYNWFMGVALSSSHQGLHVYTKIAIPQSEENSSSKKKLLYLTNFRHKYSFVYLSLVSGMQEYGYSKDDILKWMDLAMFRPQQGAFIGYDPAPLINTRFFEDFIYVCFDNVEDLGHPDIDWVSYPDLKCIFKRWEWFEDGDGEELNVVATSNPDLEFDAHNKIHYKHNERWRLANTLVKLYGLEKGSQYLRLICSNNIKDKEIQADCETASRHNKPIDVWAVNRLNSQHGFKIKLNIQDTSFDESGIITSMDRIDNPTQITKSPYTTIYNITKNQYLGNIKNRILNDLGRITLLEAGAGLGKTEMVKQIVAEGKKIIMVMPFTSVIKSKVENVEGWYYSYGNREARLDVDRGLCLTIDKFSRLNLMDIKSAGFDYIFIDESHLLFLSEYRPVMAKAVEMIRNSEIPVILMSGTPSGELAFFQNIVHLKVIKEDTRKKEISVNLVDTPSDLMFHMCRQMANDIVNGKRILFPSNAGTLYSDQIKAAVTYFLENEHMWFEPVVLNYYKKSNIGDKFMDDVNFDKTVANTQILMCTTYLSVGNDILDRYNFSIYFADIYLPHECDQWSNRLRSNDLYIKIFVAKNDADGNTRSLHRYKEMNLKVDDDEIRNIHSILRICNGMIERNPVEYKYNSLISSIIHGSNFIEYNEIESKYYLNLIAYKVIYFERKYREYAQQLPVFLKGMQAYGYSVSITDLKEFHVTGSLIFRNLKDLVKLAYDERLQLNTIHIEELMDLITEDRLGLYKEVLRGVYDIKKGEDWKDDPKNKTLIVKNIEVFEKVVPIFVSLSKQYNMDSIREIFYYCQNKNGTFNFAAINRIRLLVNIIYNDKNGRLDIPISDYMKRAYEFSDLKEVHKSDLMKFHQQCAMNYAKMESTNDIQITKSILTMEMLTETFEKLFKCLVKTTRPGKDGMLTMDRVELLWKERENMDANEFNEKNYLLADFLDNTIETQNFEEDVEMSEF